MSIKGAIIGFATALAFAGAAIAADFGPVPANYESAVEGYFAERLEDPRSARYQYRSEPYQVFADLKGYEGMPCWAVDVRVKARLPGGGYGGYVAYTVIFLDGEAIALEEDLARMVRA